MLSAVQVIRCLANSSQETSNISTLTFRLRVDCVKRKINLHPPRGWHSKEGRARREKRKQEGIAIRVEISLQILMKLCKWINFHPFWLSVIHRQLWVGAVMYIFCSFSFFPPPLICIRTPSKANCFSSLCFSHFFHSLSLSLCLVWRRGIWRMASIN